jgi:hypothetical protein
MSVTVMSSKSMPHVRPLCSTCQVAWAWLGERECGDCLFETKLGLWLLAEDHPLPGEPTPLAMSLDQALDWVSGGVIHSTPRIREVAAPSGRVEVPQRDTFWQRLPLARPLPAMVTVAHFQSVVRWMGLAVLLALTSGWLFGKLGC